MEKIKQWLYGTLHRFSCTQKKENEPTLVENPVLYEQVFQSYRKQGMKIDVVSRRL